MRLILREFIGRDEQVEFTQRIGLSSTPLTLGRSEPSPTHIQIGKSFKVEWQQAVSRVQCTIADGFIYAGKFGSPESARSSLMIGSELLKQVEISAGLTVTIFHAGLSRIEATFLDRASDEEDPSKQTYGEENLLGVLQREIESLQDAIVLLKDQVLLQQDAIAQREAIDMEQSARLERSDRRIQRVIISAGWILSAVMVGFALWTANDASRDKLMQAIAALVPIAATAYLQWVQSQKDTKK